MVDKHNQCQNPCAHVIDSVRVPDNYSKNYFITNQKLLQGYLFRPEF
ncbi:hypothetical protein QW060_25175 [Myroides ceti]|uniref:Uncharacterized protein n=1 Tax=Paenimyroides ceti TaxID=395087 RepID=A0ABT8D3Y4_9FLAO|nr:hypothetical protein [Paenimyroides ceti]MDN3710170.1 hypothetical protein [Paenimyroides ceti]